MKPTEVAQRAKEQVSSLTGLDVETVSSLSASEDGWTVVIEMVEMRRIPEASDMLGTYEVAVDGLGDVTAYKRTCRYMRCDAMDDQ